MAAGSLPRRADRAARQAPRPPGRGLARGLVVYGLLIGCGMLVTLPLAFILSTALKSTPQTLLAPPEWVPRPFVWSNFLDAWTAAPFPVYYANSLVIAALRIAGQLVSSVFIAYGFARVRFPGRNLLFLVVIGSLIVPQQVLIIPRFILFKYLGWLDTFAPLVVPDYFGAPLAIFLLRQYFLSIPQDVLDAARIDGCGHLALLWRVMLPMSRPALGAVAVFGFVETWDDFLQPLVYLTSPEHFTVELGLNTFRNEFFTQWNLFMAAALMAMVLPAAVFFVAQRYFVEGVTLAGGSGSRG
jgi:ABC-type glycerol-3-phosphate transport system permease component